jgi:hypothetical protein
MDRYIGLDAHASSCTLRVVGPSGKRLGSHVVETNARALIEALRGIPRNRHVCLEEYPSSGCRGVSSSFARSGWATMPSGAR